MTRSFDEGFESGYQRVVIIGSDCPAMISQDLTDAFLALSTADLVVGPATDGGFWLIGLNRPSPEIFDNVHWSSAQTLRDTLANAERHGLKSKSLRVLADIDTADDWELWLRNG